MEVNFSLKGEKCSVDVGADSVLMNVLRDLGCKRVKCGCETTNCGLCTVWIDGKSRLSCSVLAAGLDGIKRGLTPPASVQQDIFEMTENERLEAGIQSLPRNLYEAIHEMKKSEFMKDVLGEEVFYKYATAKRMEWNEYTSQVTDWEIDRYLGSI